MYIKWLINENDVETCCLLAEHGRLVLDEAGIRADVCHSGKEALNMLEVQSLKQKPYSLVLMDWRMPEMDGVETAFFPNRSNRIICIRLLVN